MAIRRLSSSGVIANAKSSKVWDQITLPGSFEAIASATVDSGGAASITFSNIPQNYTHLQIRGIARTNAATYAWDDLRLRLGYNNGTIDSGSTSYSFHRLLGFKGGGQGSDSNLVVDGAATNSYAMGAGAAGSGAGSSNFGAMIIDIVEYTNTNVYKTIKMVGGEDNNNTGTNTHGYVGICSSLWKQTYAVTDVQVYFSGTMQQYSTFALYGIRNS